MSLKKHSHYLSWFVGLRYAGIKSDTYLLSFLARVAMLGLVLGTALLIVVLSVMNGFDRELRERILHIVPHISLYRESFYKESDYHSPGSHDSVDWDALEKKIAADPDVREVIPFVEIEGLLKTAGDAEPLLFYGVESYPALDAYIAKDQKAVWQNTPNGILVSAYTAKKLHLALQDPVLGVLSVQRAPTHADDRQASTKPLLASMVLQGFQVVGIFDTKTELDKALVIAHRTALQTAAGLDQPQGLRVSLYDLFKAPTVEWRLLQDMPAGFTGKNWSQTHGNLYEAVQMSRSLVSLLMFVIIAVAVFNVVSTLVLVVIEKKQAIAILRVQGASARDVVRIFMVQGTFIGVIGSCVGALVGIVISLVLPDTVALLEKLFHFQILKADVYPITYIPSDLRWVQVLFVVAVAMIFSFLASLYPAWRATRIDPAQVLRYE